MWPRSHPRCGFHPTTRPPCEKSPEFRAALTFHVFTFHVHRSQSTLYEPIQVRKQKARHSPEQCRAVTDQQMLLAYLGLRKPRANVSSDRPPVGRHCPWEPTALHETG